MAASAGNPVLRQCVRLLIPGLVQYIAKMAPHVHEGTLTEVQLAGIGEVWKAFAAFFAATGEEHSACSHFSIHDSSYLVLRIACSWCSPSDYLTAAY